MLLILQCIIACILFTAIMIPPLYKNPINQIMSYPTAIRKRVESLPQYADVIKKTEKKHIFKKIIAVFVFGFILSIIAYLSGAKTFIPAFKHVFILFFVVNIYDMLVLDIGLFCHSKKSIIPGTEDMIKEYQNPWHHIRGAFIGIIIGAIVSFLSASIIYGYNLAFI